MSILIKGMKMPKDGCKDCLLVKRGNVFDICPFLKREVNGNVERGGKPYDCPIVELPDHGDLLDKDELSMLVGESFEYFLARLGLKCPKAVIPAERSKDGKD